MVSSCGHPLPLVADGGVGHHRAAFSKKLDNHKAAVALHYMHYNFARIHQTLRVTPAMEAGVSDHVWSIEGIVGLLETERVSN